MPATFCQVNPSVCTMKICSIELLRAAQQHELTGKVVCVQPGTGGGDTAGNCIHGGHQGRRRRGMHAAERPRHERASGYPTLRPPI